MEEDIVLDNKIVEQEKTEFGLVQSKPITEELSKSYLDYAMSVIVARALPDVRDGLKPVQRRILYAMKEMGLSATSKHQKSAKIVGEVMGKFHPHGDMAIYDAMVRMAQSWNLREPMVNGQGNFGSIDGDPAAAPRYSEARLTAASEIMLEDIDKETVDFIDNYDATIKEPTVLPAKLPNLLLNGATGIAVGMATNIPPHNLGEIIDATLIVQKNPDASVEDIIQVLPGPDFPTGGIIYNQEEIRQAFATGKGRVVVRGKANIEENKNRSRIVISEIPYQINKSTFISHIADLVKNKKIEGISDIRDESDREDGVRVVVDLKTNAMANKILNQLYDMTELQTVFHYNMVALIDGIQPRLLGILEVLHEYLKHRRVVVRRRTEYELKIAKARAHILEGLKIALDNLDAVIKLIRESKDRASAKAGLIEKFKLSELQSDAILEMRLSQLANLERQRVYDEYDQIMARIADLEDILAKPERVEKIITAELGEAKAKFNSPRRTEVHVEALGQFKPLDLIQNETIIITLTKGNYIKRVSPDTYKSQSRGGKGVIGMSTNEEDTLTHIIFANTHDSLLFFTDNGRVFKIPSYEVPSTSRQSKGVALPNLIRIVPEEKVKAIMPVGANDDTSHYYFSTKFGVVKKVETSQLDNVRKNGLNVLTLKPGDQILSVDKTDGNNEIYHITRFGQIIIYNESEVRAMGRGAAGVKGIKLKKDDYVIDTGALRPDSKEIMVISANGIGKRVDLSEFRHQHRGGSGIRVAKINTKTGNLVASIVVKDGDKDAIIASKQAQIIRISIDEVKKLSRVSSGVILIRMDKGDQVSNLTVVDEENDKVDIAPTPAPTEEKPTE